MRETATPTVDRLSELIPGELMDAPGHAFYSGESAFAGRSRLYLLAENPGSDGVETVRQQLNDLREGPAAYSAYATHTWKLAGRIDHSVLHLLRELSLNPTEVPASCLIFSRTRSESDLAGSFDRLADLCWPFHQMVIGDLGVDVIVCFGKRTGDYVRRRLEAHELIDQLVERNNRGWTSHTHRGQHGLKVATVTHPSRADWRNPAADVSPLVARALDGN